MEQGGFKRSRTIAIKAGDDQRKTKVSVGRVLYPRAAFLSESVMHGEVRPGRRLPPGPEAIATSGEVI